MSKPLSHSKAPGSCSTATGRCARSEAAARGRSGSPATSRRGSTSPSRSSPARGRPPRAPSARPQAAASLRHPSCLRAYAFARDSRHVYIAYEFVPGRTFREAMRAGELNDAAAIEACAQICDGLAHAHARRHPPPRREAVERAARRRRPRVGADPRLRARAHGRGRDADRAGRRARDARLHRARAAAGEDASEARPTSGRSASCSGSRSSGRHPFWQTSMLDTARAIEAGRAAARELRPGPSQARCSSSSIARSRSSPARRPVGGRARGAAARRCRAAAQEAQPRRASVARRTGAGGPRRRRRARGGFRRLERGRAAVLPARLGVGACASPRRRDRSPAAARPRRRARRARAAARERLARPRGRLRAVAAALARPLVAGAARRRCSSRSGRCSRPFAALGLVPLAASGLRSAPRRAAQAAAGRARRRRSSPGIRGVPLPFTGAPPPLGLGVAGRRRPARRRRLARAGRRRPPGAPHRGRAPSPRSLLALPSRRPAAAGAPPASARRCSPSRCSWCPPRRPLPLVAAAWATAPGSRRAPSARRRRVACRARAG